MSGVNFQAAVRPVGEGRKLASEIVTNPHPSTEERTVQNRGENFLTQSRATQIHVSNSN